MSELSGFAAGARPEDAPPRDAPAGTARRPAPGRRRPRRRPRRCAGEEHEQLVRCHRTGDHERSGQPRSRKFVGRYDNTRSHLI